MPLPSVEFLEQFAPGTFIETGSHRGDGIDIALRAGFEAIYSVDISPFCYGWCSHRFRYCRTKVHLYLGDSRDFLHNVLSFLTTPAVFWLDAHWCGGDGEIKGADSVYEVRAPLLEELDIIRTHDICTHTILIDDIRMFGTDLPTRREVLGRLRRINRNYRINHVDSRDFPSDILVATAP